MKYKSGYPEPSDSDVSLTVQDVKFEPGAQFRFPTGKKGLTGEEKYGFCYVLDVSKNGKEVEFFNVTEEAHVTHNWEELYAEIANLTKLDEKWGNNHE